MDHFKNTSFGKSKLPNFSTVINQRFEKIEVLRQIKTRRSIRNYSSEPVPQEILDQIIEAGQYAASGMGYQNTIIIRVTNRELRDEIARRNAVIGGWKEDFDLFTVHLLC